MINGMDLGEEEGVFVLVWWRSSDGEPVHVCLVFARQCLQGVN